MIHNFTSGDIAKIIGEIGILLKNGRIQEIYQPFKEEIYLEIYANGKSLYLLISVENGFNRIYTLFKRPENPLNPYSFQMLLRKYIVPSYIKEIRQINNDRVVLLFTDEFRIYAELTGRHSNIFLTDSEDIILGSLRENLSQKRPLFVSKKYIPPISNHQIQRAQLIIPEGKGVSEYYSDYYERLVNEYRMQNLRSVVLKKLNSEEWHYISILNKVRQDKKRAEDYKVYLRYAEALKQNRIVKLDEDSANCEYYTEDGIGLVKVPMIKGKNILENMQYYFKLYKKYKNSLEFIRSREKEVEKNLEEIKNKRSVVESISNMDKLSGLFSKDAEDPIIERGRKKEKKAERMPFRVFFIEGIGKIYSGSNAEENEQLTFKYSRGNDLWFHVVGYPGSHTVLPMQKDKIPSEKQIMTAALIAAARSSAPDGESVEVAYTRVKYVRKIKGGARGEVLFSNEKRVFVKVDKSFPNKLLKLV